MEILKYPILVGRGDRHALVVNLRDEPQQRLLSQMLFFAPPKRVAKLVLVDRCGGGILLDNNPNLRSLLLFGVNSDAIACDSWIRYQPKDLRDLTVVVESTIWQGIEFFERNNDLCMRI